MEHGLSRLRLPVRLPVAENCPSRVISMRSKRPLTCGDARAACRNRTDDLRITSASLWPTELRRQTATAPRAAATGRVYPRGLVHLPAR